MRHDKVQKLENKLLVNESIRFKKLRVIEDDVQHGIMNTKDALALADSKNLDLVVISESADPPIAKILSADKYFYDLKRREKELAKRQRENRIELKEIQFRPNITKHDFETKLKHINRFIGEGAKVKCMLQYKGRENANKSIGFEILNRIVEQLSNTEWETVPTINGNKLVGILRRGKNV